MRHAALLMVIGVAVYANVLHAPFVFDDLHAIVENPFVRQLWPLTQAAAAPPQSALSGRPVVSVSMAINYALGGLAPEGYHAWNLFVHVAAALLLFAIVRRHLEDRFAFIAAALWLVHPLQTEVVDYTTQRTESMMGLFFLATLYASLRGWHVAAVFACALGMATKESMVTAPAMVLLYDATFESQSITQAVRRRPWFYAGLAASWLVLLALNVSGPRSHTAGLSTRVTPVQYALSQAPMLGTYVKLIVWPHPLILDYGPVPPIAFSQVWRVVVAVLALATVVTMAIRHDRRLAFLGTWFLVTLAPASSFVPVATEVGAERRMYLPLAAVAVSAAVALRKLDWQARRLTLPIAGTLVAVLAALSIQRNTEFSAPIALWEHVLEHRPHARARNSLGLALQQAGRRDEAIAQYRAAAAQYPLAHYNLGTQLSSAGRHDEAIGEMRAWLRSEPGDADGRGVLADLLLRQRRYAEAVVEYTNYLRLTPGNAAAHNNLGLALVHANRVAEAVREFRTALALAPNTSGASQNLARALSILANQAPNGSDMSFLR